MVKSVYNELVIDLITNCDINGIQAWKIVNYLQNEGILDYDILKEYYSKDKETD